MLQGSQKVSFKGLSTDAGFVGTLRVKVLPGKGVFSSFSSPSFGATFAGAASVMTVPPAPAEGVTVTVRSDFNGDGTFKGREIRTALTGPDGKYEIGFVPAKGRSVLLDFSLDRHATSMKVFPAVQPGSTVINNVALADTEVLPVVGGTARSSDGKLVLDQLPANVAAVEGRVFDPRSESNQFPGGFVDNRNNLLVSSVFASLQATDDSGNVIRKLGAQSILRMRVSSDSWSTLGDLRSGTGKIDVPLFSFNETTGQWERAASDGWLEDGAGSIIPESELTAIRDGSYAGSVYAVGNIDHLSYWNVDWPVESHGCVQGTIVDENGNTVSGATVRVEGVTYDGSAFPVVTGTDGSFCADVLRSEIPGEDLDGDGTPGETQQVRVIVRHGGCDFQFGQFPTPSAQGSCEGAGGGACQALGSLQLKPENCLQPTLCTINGKVVFSGTASGGAPSLAPGDPISQALVVGFDENAVGPLLGCLSDGTCMPYATTDDQGSFTITVPVVTGANLAAEKSESLNPDEFAIFEGSASTSGCPAEPVTIPADSFIFRFLVATLLDADGLEAGFLAMVNDVAVCSITTDMSYYASTNGVVFPPAEPGPWLTMDLFRLNESGQVNVGTISFDAESVTPGSIGGTWTSSVSGLSGTWNEEGYSSLAGKGMGVSPIRELQRLRIMRPPAVSR